MAHNLLLSILWYVSVLVRTCMYACVCVYVCGFSPPRKNVMDSIQVLLCVVLLALWLSLMYTHFIICQWCNNHC